MNRRDNRTLLILTLFLSLALALWVAGCGKQGGGGAGDSVQTSQAPPPETPAAGSPAPSTPSTPAAPKPAAPKTHTLAAATLFVGSLEQTIDTGKNKVGDKVSLRTTEPVKAGGAIVVPAGSTVQGEVTHIDPAGRIAGGAELTIRFNELVLTDGTSYPLVCEPFALKGKGQAKESALEIGGGAVAGGVLGKVIGGSSGDVAKGAAAGAVIGTGVAIATKGKQIVLPLGQKLEVKTTEPVTVTVKKTTS